jgi:hypothetical protein
MAAMPALKQRCAENQTLARNPELGRWEEVWSGEPYMPAAPNTMIRICVGSV